MEGEFREHNFVYFIAFTHRYMKDSGIAVGELQQHGAGEAKYFYFRDNQGNLLEAAWSI